MPKIITQDTFDDVVKENILEFSMSPNEAKEETIKQFEAQGINLANIIKDLEINSETGKPVLIEALEKLKLYALHAHNVVDTGAKAETEANAAASAAGAAATDQEKLLSLLDTLDVECQKSIPHRVLASKHDAQIILLNILEKNFNNLKMGGNFNTEIVESTLKCLNSLTQNMPDTFDKGCLVLALQLLNVNFQQSIICLTLQWLQKVCIMHEVNRRNIMRVNIIEYLKPFVMKNNGKVLKEILAVFRCLVLDDDIRVEFGCAHEHARIIANVMIIDLTHLLKEYDEINILGDLLLTIGVLAVRQEICASVDEAGGLKLIFQLMNSHRNVARLNREAFKLLRALAGHDTVKLNIIREGAAPIFYQTLEIHMSNETVVSSALACIATLTLRSKENSKAFVEAGIIEMIIAAIRNHSSSKLVQRNGAWAIRNMVSRSREQCEIWLNYGIEELLNAAMMEHPSVQHDIKAALRDLGCKVELKEEWTGTAEKKILNSNY